MYRGSVLGRFYCIIKRGLYSFNVNLHASKIFNIILLCAVIVCKYLVRCVGIIQEDRQCTYNVTLRCGLAAIVAVEN